MNGDGTITGYNREKPEVNQVTIGFLQKKWRGASDSTVARLICPLIDFGMSDTFLALVSDDLEYFSQNYKSLSDLEYALSIACLSGARNIAEFLVERQDLEYSKKLCSDMLGKIAASPNADWAISMAEYMAEQRMELPKTIYRYSSFTTIGQIKEAYEKKIKEVMTNGESANPTTPRP